MIRGSVQLSISAQQAATSERCFAEISISAANLDSVIFNLD
jgi:hypothetical protein